MSRLSAYIGPTYCLQVLQGPGVQYWSPTAILHSASAMRHVTIDVNSTVHINTFSISRYREDRQTYVVYMQRLFTIKNTKV